MTGFRGIPLAGPDFFGELRFNNDKAWWAANKARWDADVREPLQALCDTLAPEFGTAKLFRPYRDVRFSADKTPYKNHQGAVVATAPAMGYYVQVSGDGLMTGGGWYAPTPETVARYRAAVDADVSGVELATIVDGLEASGFEIGGEQLKTSPRGFTAEHPRIGLLRRKHLLASTQHGTPDWLATTAAAEHVASDWRAYGALLDWLARNLG